jgi:hypothetical protein
VGCATCSWSVSRLPAGVTSRSATGAPASTGRTPVRDLVDVHYPDAEQIVLVQDNPEHPHARVAVCGIRAGRGQAASRQAGAALHAQARQLAEHGRDRAGHAGRTMPGPSPGRPDDPGAGGRGLAGRRATEPVAGSTGGSPPRTPASSSSISTPQLMTDEPLVHRGQRWDDTGRVGAGCSRLAHEMCRHRQERPGTTARWDYRLFAMKRGPGCC